MSVFIPGVVGPDTPTLNAGDTFDDFLVIYADRTIDSDVFRLSLSAGQAYLLEMDSRPYRLDPDIVDAAGNIVTQPNWITVERIHVAQFWLAHDDPDAELFFRVQQPRWDLRGDYEIRLSTVPAPAFTDGDDYFTVEPDYGHIFGAGGKDTLSLQGLSQVNLRLDRSELTYTDATGEEVRVRVQGIERFEGTDGDDQMFGSYLYFSGATLDWDRFYPSNVPAVEWFGRGGDDRLGSTEGATLFDGGEGTDTADYSAVSDEDDGINASLLRGRAWGTGHDQGDRYVSIENLIGTPNDDTLTGDHGDNVLHGNLGNDVLIGLGGDDTLSGFIDASNWYRTFGLNDQTIARYSGPQADYTITKTAAADGSMLVEVAHLDGAGWEGRDTLRFITTLEFSDGQLNVLDLPEDHGDGISAPGTRVNVGERVSVLRDLPDNDALDVDRIEVELVAGQDYFVRLESGWLSGQLGPLERTPGKNLDYDLKFSATAPDGSHVFERFPYTYGFEYSFAGETLTVLDGGAYRPVLFTAQQSGVYSFDFHHSARDGTIGGSWFEIEQVSPDRTGSTGDDTLTWDAGDRFIDAADGTDTLHIDSAGIDYARVFAGSGGDLLLYVRDNSYDYRVAPTSHFTTLRNIEELSLTDEADSVDLRLLITAENAINPVYQSTLRVLDGGDGNDELSVGFRPDPHTDREVWKNWTKPDGVLVDLSTGRLADAASGGLTLRNFERLYGSAGDDTLIGNDESNTIYGFAGNNEIHTGGGSYNKVRSGFDASVIYLGAGHNDVEVSGGSELVFDGNRSDFQKYNHRDNRSISFRNSAGDYSEIDFDPTLNSDNSIHLTFDDTRLTYWAIGTTDTGTIGNDIIYAGNEVTRVTGGQGDDILLGGRALGSHRADDTAVYRYRLSDYSIEFSTSDYGFEQDRLDQFNARDNPTLRVDYVGRWTGDGNDQIAGFSHLEFHDRTLDVHDGNYHPVFLGNGSPDIFIGAYYRDTDDDFNTATGRGGNDTMDGGAGLFDRAIYRGQREDFEIDLHEGRITVADQVAGRDGTDVLTRFDVLVFSDQTVEVSHLGEEDDDFVGSLGDDIVMATAGDDRVRGKHGDDTIDGGSGDDTAVYSYIRQQYEVRTEDGRIIVDYTGPWFGDGTDVVTDFETLEFFNTSMPVVQGGAEADSMFGTWRSEVFLGADGNDRFRGGYGDDVIDGGAGIDTALYRYRYAEYDIRRLEGGDLEVSYTGRWHGDGVDRLSGVEQLEFVDRTVMVDDLVF